MSPAMSTPEIPDAAPGADAPSRPTQVDPVDAAAETANPVDLTPPLPAVAASDAAASAPVAADDVIPPAPVSAETAILPPPYLDTRPPAWEAPTAAAPTAWESPTAAAPTAWETPTAAAPTAWETPTAAAPTAASGRPTPAASVDPTGPRIRWAGIVWGLVLATIAAVALWILLDPARQAVLTAWLVGLNPATAVAIAVLLLGLFALITGIVGIARRAQRGLERRRAASVPVRT
jgi:hypothetical protein